MSNTGRVGGMLARKNLNHYKKRSSFYPTRRFIAKKSVCATAPSRKLAGGVHLRGNIIIGGNT